MPSFEAILYSVSGVRKIEQVLNSVTRQISALKIATALGQTNKTDRRTDRQAGRYAHTRHRNLAQSSVTSLFWIKGKIFFPSLFIVSICGTGLNSAS